MKTLNKKNIACLLVAGTMALTSCSLPRRQVNTNNYFSNADVASAYQIGLKEGQANAAAQQTQVAYENRIDELEAALGACQSGQTAMCATPVPVAPSCMPSVVIPGFRLDGGADDYTDLLNRVTELYAAQKIQLTNVNRIILNMQDNTIETTFNNSETKYIGQTPEVMKDLLSLTGGYGKEIVWYTPECLKTALASQGHTLEGLGDTLCPTDKACGTNLRETLDDLMLISFNPNAWCDAGTDKPVLAWIYNDGHPQEFRFDNTTMENAFKYLGLVR